MRFGKRNQVEIEPEMNAGMLIEPPGVGAFRRIKASAACIYIMYLV
jgi:hypothetical protein